MILVCLQGLFKSLGRAVLRASAWLRHIDLIMARSYSISIYRAIDE